MAQGKQIASLFIKLGLDSKEFADQLKKIDGQTKAWGKGLASIGIALEAVMGVMTKEFASTAQNIAVMAQKTGLSLTATQELGHAATVTNSSIEGLGTGIKQMQSFLLDAADGTLTAQKTLKSLGIELDRILSLSPEEQFNLIASAIADISDPTTRAAKAVDVFGRSGTEMLPMLANGAAGLKKLRNEAVILSDEQIRAGSRLEDSLENLEASFKALSNSLASTFAPAVTSYTQSLDSMAKSLKNLTEKNPELISVLSNATLSFGLSAAAIGTMIWQLPKMISFLNLTKMSFQGLGLAVGGLTAGLTLMLTGFQLLFQHNQKANEQHKTSIRLHQEYTKYLAGETNELYESLKAHADAVEIYAQASGMSKEAKQEAYEYAKKAREAAEELTRAEDDAKNRLASAISKIEEKYGDYKDVVKSATQTAKDARDDRLRYLDDEIDRVNLLHDRNLAANESEYQRGLSDLEKKYQAEIDTLDDEEKAEDRARRKKENADDVMLLKQKIFQAKSASERFELQQELDRKLQEISAQEVDWQRDDARQILRDKIDAVRDGTDEEAQQLLLQKQTQDSASFASLQVELNNIALRKQEATNAFDTRMTEIETLKNTEIAAAKAITENELNEIRKRLVVQDLAKSGFIPEDFSVSGDITSMRGRISLPNYDIGGIIPGPVGAPMAAVVHGGEMVIPAGKSGIVNNFTINGLVVREDADIQKIARQLYRMQQMRM